MGDGKGGADELAPIWAILDDAGAGVVLSGHDHDFEQSRPNREVRNDGASGVLAPILYPDGYDWAFVAANGHSLTDAGTAARH